MMMRNATKIEWEDPAECIPAFITMIGIPLSYSIADGVALGFMADPVIKLCSGRGRKIGWLTYVLAAVLLAYFIFIRSRMP
jgi:AGZA family xanthine/uracil permease-like MFS transporter